MRDLGLTTDEVVRAMDTVVRSLFAEVYEPVLRAEVARLAREQLTAAAEKAAESVVGKMRWQLVRPLDD